MKDAKLTITKRIAKQGKNLIIVIPKDLHDFLSQGDLVKIQIDRLQLASISKEAEK